jgi:hypothetical protein
MRMAKYVAAAPSLRRGRAAIWTRERIEIMKTPEVRALLGNAMRLGEHEIVAVCDAVLGSRPNGRQVERRPNRKRATSGLTTRGAGFALRGVTPKSRIWSRGGVRAADGAVVLALWADDAQSGDGQMRWLLWAPNVEGARAWSDSAGGKERLAHCKAALEQGRAEALRTYGVRLEDALPEERVRHLDGVDSSHPLVLSVEKRGEEYWGIWDCHSYAPTLAVPIAA